MSRLLRDPKLALEAGFKYFKILNPVFGSNATQAPITSRPIQFIGLGEGISHGIVDSRAGLVECVGGVNLSVEFVVTSLEKFDKHTSLSFSPFLSVSTS